MVPLPKRLLLSLPLPTAMPTLNPTAMALALANTMAVAMLKIVLLSLLPLPLLPPMAAMLNLLPSPLIVLTLPHSAPPLPPPSHLPLPKLLPPLRLSSPLRALKISLHHLKLLTRKRKARRAVSSVRNLSVPVQFR